LQSDKDTIALLNYNPIIFGSSNVVHNIKVLTESGVTDSNIARLLRTCTKLFYRKDLHELVEELKDLGFDPPRSIFSIALMAKSSVSETLWKEKVDAFKKWGWSDEDALKAFRKQPHCMLTSIDKINLVMSYWVNQLGWDAMAIAKVPRVFGASMEQRIIPRASVVQYLSKKGLLKKEASLTSPFVVKEEIFLDMYINRFKEESSYLLKLYEEKLKLAQTKEKTAMI
jgi:mTERF domain-containing protein